MDTAPPTQEQKRKSSMFQAAADMQRGSTAAVFYDTISADPEDAKKWRMLEIVRLSLITTLLLIIILVLLDVIPLMDTIGDQVVQDVRDMGVGGGFLYIVISIAFVIICVPNSLLALAAGYIWENTFYGFLASWPGVLLGCIASLYIGRFVFKDLLEAEFRHYRKFFALSQATEEHGAKVVFFGRISPIPSGLLNYAFSISRISVVQFTLATAIGLIPICVGYAKVGSDFYTYFETDELQEAVTGCTLNDAPSTCCAAVADGSITTTYAEYASGAATRCAVLEVYDEWNPNFDYAGAGCSTIRDYYKNVATCLETNGNSCSFSSIEDEADDLECRYNDDDCLEAEDNNSCLKELNNKELWPKIVLPLSLFLTLLLVGYFGNRALERGLVMQVTYDFDRQRELLVAELEHSDSAAPANDV